MQKYIITLLSIIIASFLLFGNENHKNDSSPDMDKMKIYWMVFLKSGKNRSQSDEEAQKLQMAHLGNMTKMAEEGKLVMAGPFTDNENIRGIWIFDVDSKEEVIELCKTDPMVQIGRLDYEIHPWMTEKGTCLPSE